MYERIVFDKPPKEQNEETKSSYKFLKCVYQLKNAHDLKNSAITCVQVLPKGIFVTGGQDCKIRFWDPIGLHCMAIITESKPILNIFGADSHIYYSMENKVQSFYYLRPKFEVLFEDEEEQVTQICNISDLGGTIMFVGTNAGLIYFIDRKQKNVTAWKKYHEPNKILALHHKNETLISSDDASNIVIFNTNTLQ